MTTRAKHVLLLAVKVSAAMVCVAGIPIGVGAQTNQIKTAPPSAIAPAIKTTFVPDAKLTKAEVDQVVKLAKKCGVKEIAEVQTFYYLPSSTRGISVKSVERIEGRNTFYDTVLIKHPSWDDHKPDFGAMKEGEFWVSRPYLYTTVLREFQINDKRVRVTIGDGIGKNISDKVIPLIAAKKVHFQDELRFQDAKNRGEPYSMPYVRTEFEKLDLLQPNSIDKSMTDEGSYQIEFPGQKLLYFKFEKGEVIVTGVGSYVI